MRLHDCLTRTAGTWPGGPGLTRKPRDGWLRTAECRLARRGRALFVTGEIVYPVEADAPYRRGTVAEAAVAGEDDQRPGQLVHALIGSAAGGLPAPAEIMGLGQDHRGGCVHSRSVGIRGMLTRMGAGKIGTRLLLESATPHA